MNYQETIEYIHKTPKFSRELGNNMLKKLLMELNNPQNDLKYIHIAGTNGKGSTAVMIAEILKNAGYRVGLYTSPYIERFNERIRINGAEIPDVFLEEIVTKIRNIIEEKETPVSEFALDTAVAFEYFKREKCDIVVLETGLGGRLDATNVIEKNIVSVITPIGLDHTQYLGETIEEVAREKCGIFKKNCPVVVSVQQETGAVAVIKECANSTNSPIYYSKKAKRDGKYFTVDNRKYELKMQGDFQAYNASLALKTIEVLRECGFKISESAVENGFKTAVNIARYEYIADNIIIDGGHNPHGAKALVESLKKLNEPICLCVAMMEDKDIEEVAKILSEVAVKVVVTEIDMPRCCNAKKVGNIFEKYTDDIVIIPNLNKAIDRIKELSRNMKVCVCGSLYLVGSVRQMLR